MLKPTLARWAFAIPALLATASAQLLSFDAGQSEYQLAARGGVVPVIRISNDDWPGVRRVGNDLAADFGRVTGTAATVSNANALTGLPAGRPVIIAGTIGRSSLITSLVSAGKIDVSSIQGKWESYTSQVVMEPTAGVPWALVIAGSDRRGVMYGMYDISETMGVSPWYYWADVPTKTKNSVSVNPNGGKVQGPPSVKYRGFFINDENPALQGWIAANTGGYNSRFYRLVFELLLRLKGNYFWPAMWGKSFYVDDAQNGPMAEEFGVVMGTTHHEPMARSEREQQTSAGQWDWSRNKAGVTRFFEGGITRAKNWETMWTMGMRGSGDAASPTLNAAALQDVIQVQQGLLTRLLNEPDLSKIPQTWVLYKEVSGYYADGLKVPDTVTLLWTDDNSGNIVRVPTAAEVNRLAGAGVYYHFDYVGSPRNYKWINTIQAAKTWEQMHLAYEKGARQIWIANVGDLKPLEVPLTQFMDMAYDMNMHQMPDSATRWYRRWATREFGAAVSNVTAEIMNEYGILTARRKYELFSTHWPFSSANYDEVEDNLARWHALMAKAEAAYNSLDATTQISYFQTVYHPILAGGTVVDLYTKVNLNAHRATQGRTGANALATAARALFTKDGEITRRYHTLNGGKWNSFVNQPHIGYTNWQDPASNTMPSTRSVAATSSGSPLGVAIQGSTTSSHTGAKFTLAQMDPFMGPAETRYIDVFTRRDGTFPYTVTSSAPYVTLSNSTGSLVSPGDRADGRVGITVDWDAAPAGLTQVTLTVVSGTTAIATGTLPVNKLSPPPSTFSGFVESGGVVSMEAAHFSSSTEANGVSYVIIPHYGRTLSAVKSWPVTAPSQTAANGPALKYRFYTHSAKASGVRLQIMLGASLNHDPTRLLKLAYAVDGATPTTVQPVPTQPAYQDGQAWQQGTIANGYTSTHNLPALSAGAHELSLWLLEPGVVLQKVIVDLGGLKTSALGPWESFRV